MLNSEKKVTIEWINKKDENKTNMSNPLRSHNDKNKLSNSMAMFIIINTASMQLIPTTVIAIRSSLNSSNPTKNTTGNSSPFAL